METRIILCINLKDLITESIYFTNRNNEYKKLIESNTIGTDTPNFLRQKWLNKDTFCNKWLYNF